MKTGSCLCGAVAYEVHGPLDDILVCHCTQCRKQTGHYWASTHCTDKDLKFVRQDGLKWFHSSDMAKRGFCKECGSTLFWKKLPDDGIISISAGTIDGKTGLQISAHLFEEDKGDYYEIAADAPRR
ncbi:GFA family protein [Aestuariivirga litoralis]|uniref:GFA family protein n=1 Tax=Aestuariivirga litoralis TaxID=2650924 RepID=UPI001AEDDACE|nr:GFA family protein [Aestuariivirga litoralis]